MKNSKSTEIKENIEDMSKENDMNESEEIQDIDYDLVNTGPLYVDPKHIKPGYVPCFVADRPGEIEMYKRWGYSIVLDEFPVGDNVASKSSRFGSAVTVQSKCGTMLVLMAIKKELHDKLMAHREKQNKLREQSLGVANNIPIEHQQYRGQSLSEFKITKK